MALRAMTPTGFHLCNFFHYLHFIYIFTYESAKKWVMTI